MRTKKLTIPGDAGYRELLQALEHDGKSVEQLTIEAVEKIDRMMDDELFNRVNLDSIQSLARESVVNVPASVDEKNLSHLVIKSNEKLEILVERVKYQAFLFTENAEKIRGLIDLHVIQNYELQLSWKNELVQMQGQISLNHMEMLSYYRERSEIGIHLLKQPRISDYWIQLIEIDEDFFFKLRLILFNLRLFNLRLYYMVYRWLHFSKNTT